MRICGIRRRCRTAEASAVARAPSAAAVKRINADKVAFALRRHDILAGHGAACLGKRAERRSQLLLALLHVPAPTQCDRRLVRQLVRNAPPAEKKRQTRQELVFDHRNRQHRRCQSIGNKARERAYSLRAELHTYRRKRGSRSRDNTARSVKQRACDAADRENGRIFETYAESARHSRQTAVQQPAAAGNDESYKKRRHYRRSETEHAVLAHRPYKAEYPGEQRRLIVNGESLFAVAEHRKGNAQRSRRAYREQQRKRIVIQHSVAEEADRAARYRSCNG